MGLRLYFNIFPNSQKDWKLGLVNVVLVEIFNFFQFMNMAVGWGTPPFECFALLIYFKNFNILLIFLMRLLHYIWNNYNSTVSTSINRYSNVINGNKNIKSCEFCVKILHQECRKRAKKLWSWWNMVCQLYETNIF